MRNALTVTPTLVRQPNLARRMFDGVFRSGIEQPTFAVRVADIDLRRSGHVTAGGPEVVQVREEFRAVKKHIIANLSSSANGRDPRVVLVTSARPNEGKTFVSLNLALNLAVDRDLRVTLIDGDVASAGLTRRLNLGGERGLLDSLSAGDGAVAQSSNVTNLAIVPSGRLRSDATELLSGPRMSRLLDSFPGMIVIDSAAVLSGSSAAVLARSAGQIVFVIGCNETSRAVIDESLSVLDADIGPLESANLGLVLNKIDQAQSPARYSARS